MTSIVKWLANGRLTIEAMSPKLVVSLLLNYLWCVLATDCTASYSVFVVILTYIVTEYVSNVH